MLRVMIILAVVAVLLVAIPILRSWSIERRHPIVGDMIKVDGGEIHVLSRGSGTPVVMVHGASSNLRDWTASIFDDVAAKYQAIAVDRPGHGWSTRTADKGHDPRVQARLLHDALTEMGVERPILVGHSWAGTLVLAYALDYPEETGGVLFLGGVSHPWPGGVDWHHHAALTPILGPIFTRVVVPIGFWLRSESGVKNVFGPNTPTENYAERTAVALFSRPGEFTANAEDIVNLKPIVAEMAERYSEISVPLIALTGDDDDIILTNVHTPPLVEKVPGAELRMLEGVGHLPHHAVPDAVLTAIDDLVALRDAD